MSEGTPAARRALLAASLGWALDAFDVMLYALVLSALLADFSITTATAGLLGSLTLIASGLGGVLFGALADRIGRRPAMIGSILVYSVFTAACGLSQNIWQLGVFRFLLGLGMGGEWTSGAAMVSETWPDRHRGKAVAIMQSSWAVGYAVAALVVAFVLPTFGWRAVFFVGLLPALLTLWIRRGIEESGVWLASKKGGRDAKAATVRDVFRGRFAGTTALLTILSTSTIFAYWGLNLWVPAFLSLPPERGGLGLSTTLTTVLVVTMQVGTFLGYVSFGYVADAIGRRKAFVSYILLAAVLTLVYSAIDKPVGAARDWTARGVFRNRILLRLRSGDGGNLSDIGPRYRPGIYVQHWPPRQRGRALHRRFDGANARIRRRVRHTRGRTVGGSCDLDLVARNSRAERCDVTAMKLASLKVGRDGRLIVVSRDLARYADATAVAPTLLAAVDDWSETAPRLQEIADALEAGGVRSFAVRSASCAAPLPRSFGWADGSAYVNHVALVRQARGAEVPASFWTDPLMYRGGSEGFSGPAIRSGRRRGLGHRSRSGSCGDHRRRESGRDSADAAGAIRLVMLVNDVSLRNLIPAELAKGFGFLQSKAQTAFSPVAVTPDELGSAWDGTKVHCRCSAKSTANRSAVQTRAST